MAVIVIAQLEPDLVVGLKGESRIDRLPATATVWRAILLLSAGMFFELYDLLFPGYVAPGLVKAGILTTTTPGLFGSTGAAKSWPWPAAMPRRRAERRKRTRRGRRW